VFKYLQLEGCIDDEHQFKTAKRSQGTPQAPGDATILKRFFRDNLRYFSSQIEKNSIFWISEFFYVCNFSIFVMVTWPLFGTIQGPISVKCLVTDSPDYQKALDFRVSAFHPYHWFGVKLFPLGCAQDRRRYPKNAKKNLFLDLAPPTL